MDTTVLNLPGGQSNELQDLKAEVAGLKGEVREIKTALQAIRASEAEGRDMQRKFTILVDQWKAGRGHTSSSAKMATHPAYLKIIGMGKSALPLIFRELELRPDHWFIALQAITGTDPVPEAVRGRVNEMARIWVDWGRHEGFEW